jgi:hypothetical protein
MAGIRLRFLPHPYRAMALAGLGLALTLAIAGWGEPGPQPSPDPGPHPGGTSRPTAGETPTGPGGSRDGGDTLPGGMVATAPLVTETPSKDITLPWTQWTIPLTLVKPLKYPNRVLDAWVDDSLAGGAGPISSPGYRR